MSSFFTKQEEGKPNLQGVEVGSNLKKKLPIVSFNFNSRNNNKKTLLKAKSYKLLNCLIR